MSFGPGVEIESCASGGARVDLGILAHTDRVWASDTNDALKRQTIQRWTGLLLPPELIGAHVGPPRSHTTGRVHDLSSRVATALFESFGFEWDLTQTAPDERRQLAEAVSTYKRLRGLLHAGDIVHGDVPDPSARLHGVAAHNGTAAVFAYVQLTWSPLERSSPVALPGLDPERRYDVRVLDVAGGPRVLQRTASPWLTNGSLQLSGQVLRTVGLALPV